MGVFFPGKLLWKQYLYYCRNYLESRELLSSQNVRIMTSMAKRRITNQSRELEKSFVPSPDLCMLWVKPS